MTTRADRFTAVLDTNVIMGSAKRHILFCFANAGFYRLCWSSEILDEFERSFSTKHDDAKSAAFYREEMETDYPEAIVKDYEIFIDVLDELPDFDDRHVVACAIKTCASVIVTENTKDFPKIVLQKYKMKAMSSDDFIADILDRAGDEAVNALDVMRAEFNNPTMDFDGFVKWMVKGELKESAKILSEILSKNSKTSLRI